MFVLEEMLIKIFRLEDFCWVEIVLVIFIVYIGLVFLLVSMGCLD